MYETEIREVDKEKKRIKIHYKGFSEDTDEAVASRTIRIANCFAARY